MRTRVCYGDSNTWGSDPDAGERFAEEHRKLGGALAARVREIPG